MAHSTPAMVDQVLTAAWIHYPYLRRGLSRLTPVERPGLGTVAVDKYWRLYYDSAALARWGVQQSALIVAEHELAHLARRHHARSAALEAEPRRWSLAADAEINDDLDGLPCDTITPAALQQPEGLLAEQYYAGAIEQAPEQPTPEAQQDSDPAGTEDATGRDPGASGSSAEGSTAQDDDRSAGDGPSADGATSGSDAGATAASGTGSDSTGGAQPGTADGEGDASPAVSSGCPRPSQSAATHGAPTGAPSKEAEGNAAGPGSDASSTVPGCCGGGSGVTDRPAPWEAPPPGDPGAPPGLRPAEAERARRELMEDVRRIVERSDRRGTVPGSWRRWVDRERADRTAVSWQTLLRRAIGRATIKRGRQDYTYARPSRRQYGRGVLVPASIERPQRVVIVVDTSASRSDFDLANDMRDVEAICRVIGEIRVLAVDADVQWSGRTWSSRAIRDELRGGGGTDLRVGFAAVDRLRADVCVVLTDGHTPWPETPPRYRTIVVTTEGKAPEWTQEIQRI